MKLSTISAVLSGLFVAGSAVLAAGPVSASEQAKGVDYVALGDSYAAGVGAGAEKGACRVTDGAYPTLWAATGDKTVSLTQASCSGASSAEVITKQLDRLNGGTDLVTITVGANDLELVHAMEVCADSGQAQTCATELAAIRSSLTSTLPAGLSRALASVRAKAPRAKLAVVGYPLPFEDVAECAAVPLPKTVRDAADTAVAGLNQVLGATAAASGATFVDVNKRFAGHGLCSSVPWLIGAEGLATASALHPNLQGQQMAYLPALTDVIGSPSQVLAWIAERDETAPSAGVPASPEAGPTTDVSAAPGITPTAGPAEGDGGGAALPVTGANAWLMTGIGLAVLVCGVVTYRLFGPRRIRTVSE